MKPAYRLIEGPYLRELQDQPEAVWETTQTLALEHLRDLPGQLGYGAFDRVVLTGMGASFHALHLAISPLLAFGLPVLAIETAELIHTQVGLLSGRTLLIAVSQSGRSAETLRLLERVPAGCRLVGITNDPQSLLAEKAQTPVILRAGTETSVSCKTYLATVAALLWLVGVLRGEKPSVVAEELGSVAAAIADYLSWWRDHTEALAGVLEPIHHLLVLGRGPSLAAAGAGALIIKEAARFPAEVMSSAAFRHGPIEMVSAETAVFILEGVGAAAELNQKLYGDLEGSEAAVHLLDRKTALPALRLPTVSDGMLPLVEILPLQMTSLALAALRGQEAGRFLRTSKITAVE